MTVISVRTARFVASGFVGTLGLFDCDCYISADCQVCGIRLCGDPGVIRL